MYWSKNIIILIIIIMIKVVRSRSIIIKVYIDNNNILFAVCIIWENKIGTIIIVVVMATRTLMIIST